MNRRGWNPIVVFSLLADDSQNLDSRPRPHPHRTEPQALLAGDRGGGGPATVGGVTTLAFQTAFDLKGSDEAR